jgi:Mg-chelatase subunit ChlD
MLKHLFQAVVVTSVLCGAGVASAASDEAKVAQPAARPTLEVVFVLDTTSSMSGLIEGAKQKIWSIASRMASGKPTPRIRVGLVAYRDQGDAYVTKRFDLTEDLDAMYGNLKGLTAEGGGDTPEHVGRGLGEAVKLMTWSQDPKTARLIFLVGDAPAHDDYHDGWELKTWAKRAVEKGIVVNTIRCGSDADTEREFREVAKLADGSFVSIGQEGGMVAVATPYDAEMSKLNAELADKTLVGGAAPARVAAEGALKEMKAMAPSAAADRISYRAKVSPAAPMVTVSTSGAGAGIDLTREPTKVNELPKDQLPDALRGMSDGERVKYVEKVAAEKKAAESKLVTLSKQRDEWVTTNAKAAKGSFDDQVFESVKRKAEVVGVKY